MKTPINFRRFSPGMVCVLTRADFLEAATHPPAKAFYIIDPFHAFLFSSPDLCEFLFCRVYMSFMSDPSPPLPCFFVFFVFSLNVLRGPPKKKNQQRKKNQNPQTHKPNNPPTKPNTSRQCRLSRFVGAFFRDSPHALPHCSRAPLSVSNDSQSSNNSLEKMGLISSPFRELCNSFPQTLFSLFCHMSVSFHVASALKKCPPPPENKNQLFGFFS